MSLRVTNKNYSNLYMFTTLILYLLSIIFLLNRNIGLYNIFLIVVAFLLYYVANIFDISSRYYRISDFLTVIVINFILFLYSQVTGVFFLSENIILFGIVSMYQIIYKYVVNVSIVKKQKILFIDINKDGEELLSNLKKDEQYKVVGILQNLNKEQLMSKLITMCRGKNTDILVDFSNIVDESPEIVSELFEYKQQGLQYYDYIDFYEEYETKLPISNLSPKWFLEAKGFEIYHNNFNLRMKRIIDIIFAIVIGVLAIPVMLLAMIIIKFESKGPIFFKQERIGEGNKKFNIIKFRSMRSDAEKDGPKWAKENDNRVTKWGKIMRATRIDELPQIINVLRGEMSFVGPRPEREFFINQLEKEIPHYKLRHTVKPGLTGWAQVMYPYGASVEDAYSKLQYDLYYIKHHNLLFDLKIFLKTISIVVFGKGR